MKLKTFIISFILCLGNLTKAQSNLVLNPSFEQHTQCPNNISQISYCNNWYDGALNSTCDYYSANSCTGNYAPPLLNLGGPLIMYQQPLSGQSFAAFIPYYTNPSPYLEFIQGKFNASLVNGKTYYVEFYINATSHLKYYLHDIAALITDTQVVINPPNVQIYTPQILPLTNKIYSDTSNWMRINGYYSAHGGENYITIGNYTTYGQEVKDSSLASNTIAEAYYFIDSVGVYEVNHLDAWDAGPDKTINYGDSVQIGNPCSDLSMFDWTNSINDITYLSDSTNSNPWGKPWRTTTYYVTKTQGTNVFKDTVTVNVIGGTGIKPISNNFQVTVYPNPAKDKICVTGKNIREIKLFDVLGEQVISTKENEVDVSSLNAGVYLYTAINQQGLVKTGRIIIIK